MSVPSLPFPHTGVAAAAAGHRQVLIPYAAMTGVDWQYQGQPLKLPQLDAVLTRLAAADTLSGDEDDLSPPHERMAALGRTGRRQPARLRPRRHGRWRLGLHEPLPLDRRRRPDPHGQPD